MAVQREHKWHTIRLYAGYICFVMTLLLLAFLFNDRDTSRTESLEARIRELTELQKGAPLTPLPSVLRDNTLELRTAELDAARRPQTPPPSTAPVRLPFEATSSIQWFDIPTEAEPAKRKFNLWDEIKAEIRRQDRESPPQTSAQALIDLTPAELEACNAKVGGIVGPLVGLIFPDMCGQPLVDHKKNGEEFQESLARIHAILADIQRFADEEEAATSKAQDDARAAGWTGSGDARPVMKPAKGVAWVQLDSNGPLQNLTYTSTHVYPSGVYWVDYTLNVSASDAPFEIYYRNNCSGIHTFDRKLRTVVETSPCYSYHRCRDVLQMFCYGTVEWLVVPTGATRIRVAEFVVTEVPTALVANAQKNDEAIAAAQAKVDEQFRQIKESYKRDAAMEAKWSETVASLDQILAELAEAQKAMEEKLQWYTPEETHLFFKRGTDILFVIVLLASLFSTEFSRYFPRYMLAITLLRMVSNLAFGLH